MGEEVGEAKASTQDQDVGARGSGNSANILYNWDTINMNKYLSLQKNMQR